MPTVKQKHRHWGEMRFFFLSLVIFVHLGIDFFQFCAIILTVPPGGLAQLVRAHASHA